MFINKEFFFIFLYTTYSEKIILVDYIFLEFVSTMAILKINSVHCLKFNS